MSVAVSVEALQAQVDEFGEHPYLTTVSAEGRAHVVSVSASVDGDLVVIQAGRTSRANLGVNPAATLLWAAKGGGPYCLIVDGDAVLPDGDQGEIAIHPSRAVLHRLAGAAQDLPSCVPLEQPE